MLDRDKWILPIVIGRELAKVLVQLTIDLVTLFRQFTRGTAWNHKVMSGPNLSRDWKYGKLVNLISMPPYMYSDRSDQTRTNEIY